MLFATPLLDCGFVLLLAYSIVHYALSRNSWKEYLAGAPCAGGIAVFGAFVFSAFIVNAGKLLPSWNFIFAGVLILFAAGLKEDISGLSRAKKTGARLLSALILAGCGGIRIMDLHGILGLHALSYTGSLGLTVLGCLLLTFAFDLAERMNGWAVRAGLIVFTVYGGYFAYMGSPGLAAVSFALLGALAAFIRFPFSPAGIRIGHTGSLITGFMAAVLSVQFIQLYPESSASIVGPPGFVMTLAFLLPVFGVSGAFLQRLSKKHAVS